MELDLEIGDVILAGKFKNKRKIVKDIGKDDLGQPTINGMKVLNFRIEKLMPKDKWSKKSKEALEFAEDVNEMKITKRQLKRIIREQMAQGGFAGSPEQAPFQDATLKQLVPLLRKAIPILQEIHANGASSPTGDPLKVASDVARDALLHLKADTNRSTSRLAFDLLERYVGA